MSPTDDSVRWIPETELLRDFSRETLWVWRTKNCFVLGKRLRTREGGGTRFYWRREIDQIKELSERSPLEPLPLNGCTYLSLQLSRQRDPALRRLEHRLRNWLGSTSKRCPLLAGCRPLDAEKVPFYNTRGFRYLWMVNQDDLQEIVRNLKAGRVPDGIHGPGVNYDEALRMGFGRDVLRRLHKRGAPELDGEKLNTWKEYRCASDSDVCKVRVFDPDYLKRLQDARRSPPRPDRQGFSDREALEKYPHYIRYGDLATWRGLAKKQKPCQWLGRPLDSWKDSRTREWRTSPTDLATIVEAMKAAHQAAGRWIDPESGKLYLALSPFKKLTGMPEQQIAKYREGPGCLRHTALGGPIHCKQVPMPSRRNRHAANYVYLEAHGQAIAEWKKSGRKRTRALPTTTPNETPSPANGAAGTEPPRTAEPFFRSPLQDHIWSALDGKAATADALELLLHTDRRRLYYGGTPDKRGGLDELVKRGLVLSGKGMGIRGYFRPDRPPVQKG
jgi:hypothetical protein